MDDYMRMASVPDGNGGFIHKLVPAGAPEKKGKKKAHIPDPIAANPDAAAQTLKQFVERIENLEEERRDIGEDIRDVYSEAKSRGFDTKGIKTIVAMRRMDGNTRAEMEAILDTYKSALGIS